jgi:hypothetical protein
LILDFNIFILKEALMFRNKAYRLTERNYMNTTKKSSPLDTSKIDIDIIDQEALLEPADQEIADAEVAYGRDHDNRLAHYERESHVHTCKGPQCKDENDSKI